MAVSDEFSAFLTDQLADFGPVDIKRMFGGIGVFADGLMIGLVANEVLYFKVDDENRVEFEDEALAPFMYSRKGGEPIAMSYMRAPERCMDDRDEMTAWARSAFDAALRADKKKPAKKAKRKK